MNSVLVTRRHDGSMICIESESLQMSALARRRRPPPERSRVAVREAQSVSADRAKRTRESIDATRSFYCLSISPESSSGSIVGRELRWALQIKRRSPLKRRSSRSGCGTHEEWTPLIRVDPEMCAIPISAVRIGVHHDCGASNVSSAKKPVPSAVDGFHRPSCDRTIRRRGV